MLEGSPGPGDYDHRENVAALVALFMWQISAPAHALHVFASPFTLMMRLPIGQL